MQQASSNAMAAPAELPTTSRIALALLGFLAIGPFVTGLDLWLRFLPDYPAFRHFYEASALGHALWIGSGVLALVTIALIRRRQFVASAIASAAFTAANMVGAPMVWGQSTYGPWLAIATFVFCVAGAIVARRDATRIGDAPTT